MTKQDALIAKALSTDHEEEAFACLRQARKHYASGATTTPPPTAQPGPTQMELFREIDRYKHAYEAERRLRAAAEVHNKKLKIMVSEEHRQKTILFFAHIAIGTLTVLHIIAAAG